MKPQVGTIGWLDITSEHAPLLRDFYRAVVGWSPSAVPVESHEDYCMSPGPDRAAVAGICHAKGANAGLPSGWLIYIVVTNLEESLAQAKARGGTVLRPRVNAGGSGSYAVLQDPCHNAFALFEPAH
jgi:uncharacterized protein